MFHTTTTSMYVCIIGIIYFPEVANPWYIGTMAHGTIWYQSVPKKGPILGPEMANLTPRLTYDIMQEMVKRFPCSCKRSRQ